MSDIRQTFSVSNYLNTRCGLLAKLLQLDMESAVVYVQEPKKADTRYTYPLLFVCPAKLHGVIGWDEV